MSTMKLKEFMFTFEGGGWNTVWAKTRKGAVKAALKEYKDSPTLNPIPSSVHQSTPEGMERALALFY